MTFAVTYDFVNGNVADADEVNTNFEDIEDELNGVTDDSLIGKMIGSAAYGMIGAIAKGAAQAIWNADYEGWNSNLNGPNGVPDETYFVFDTFQDATKRTAEDEDNVVRDREYDYLFAVEVMYDKHNDSSLDSALWTNTSGGSETTDYLSVSNSGGGTYYTYSQGSGSDFDARALATDVYVYFYMNSSGSGSWNTGVYVCDDGNSSRVGTLVSNSTGNHMYTLHFDYAAETVRAYYADGTAVGAAQDISSLSEWRIAYGAAAPGGGNSATIEIYYTAYTTAATGSLVAESANLTSSETGTITHALLIVNDDQTLGSIDYTLSADNGGNYESVTPGMIHTFTNTGNDLKIKSTFTTAATGSSKLSEYAIFYIKS